MPRRRTLPSTVHHCLHISAATPSFCNRATQPHFTTASIVHHFSISIVSIKFKHGIVVLSKQHDAPPSLNDNSICFGPTDKAPPSFGESCLLGFSCLFLTRTLFVLSERQIPCPFRLTSPFALSRQVWIVVFCDQTKLHYY